MPKTWHEAVDAFCLWQNALPGLCSALWLNKATGYHAWGFCAREAFLVSPQTGSVRP
jgi:hypothetical protein